MIDWLIDWWRWRWCSVKLSKLFVKETLQSIYSAYAKYCNQFSSKTQLIIIRQRIDWQTDLQLKWCYLLKFLSQLCERRLDQFQSILHITFVDRQLLTSLFTLCLLVNQRRQAASSNIHQKHFIQHKFTKKHAQTTLYALIYAAWCGSSCNEHATNHSAHKNATKDRHKSSRLQWELVITDDNDLQHQSLTHNTHVTLTPNLTYP